MAGAGGAGPWRVAIGRLVIRRAAVIRLHIGEVDIDHLRVRRLEVLERD